MGGLGIGTVLSLATLLLAFAPMDAAMAGDRCKNGVCAMPGPGGTRPWTGHDFKQQFKAEKAHRDQNPQGCPKSLLWNGKRCVQGGMACPYLSAWDDQTKSWKTYRKVITKAHGRANQTTDIVELEKVAYRFRLRELEQEISFIDRVQLLVDLRDGRQLILAPTRSDLAKTEGTYKKLYPGKKVEVSFRLPEDVAAKDVARSRLSVTGYYVVIDGSLSN